MPTANLLWRAVVAAVAGAWVGATVAAEVQADSNMAATKKMAVTTYNGLFLDITDPPPFIIFR
jgi:hypothetical protein